MGKVLAIDYGRRRIGIAISDSEKTVAIPMKTIDVKKTDPVTEIKRIVEEYAVDEIVLGLPLLPDGQEGISAREVRSFKDKLSEILGLPISFVDERLTTIEATERLREYADIRKKKDRIDAIAAQLILETYLASKK